MSNIVKHLPKIKKLDKKKIEKCTVELTHQNINISKAHRQYNGKHEIAAISICRRAENNNTSVKTMHR